MSRPLSWLDVPGERDVLPITYFVESCVLRLDHTTLASTGGYVQTTKRKGTTHRQGLRIFGSFDLVGSTALKLRAAHSASESNSTDNDRPGVNQSPDWLRVLDAFFRIVPLRLQSSLQQYFDVPDQPIVPLHVDIWRVTGDEVLFVSGFLEKRAGDQILVVARAFDAVLQSVDSEFRERYGLGVKGTIWTAGFPIRNVEILISPRLAPHIRAFTLFDSTESAAEKHSGTENEGVPFKEERDPFKDDLQVAPDIDGAGLIREFQGLEIDLGFRLAALAQPGRLLASLEVAYYLAMGSLAFTRLAPKFHHVGWSRLRGVYGEVPYPILWLRYGEEMPPPRVSYEEELSPFCRQFLREESRRTADKIVKLEEDYLKDTRGMRIHPYIDTDAEPYGTHEAIHDAQRKG